MVGTARLADRYELGRLIATGGMGSVYEAHDHRLDRSVAVKVLRDDLSTDDEFVERFRREARAAAAMNHPNIASVYDFGDDAGRDFIVMELLEGEDLAERLTSAGALSPEEASKVATDVAIALAYAHERGVVHRDIKPANIFLTKDGRTKVTDFGIARASGDATLTVAGSLMGTARYIAPEQAASEPVGPAADVYSLGLVLYEMLTGVTPFEGDSPVAVAARRLTEDVPPPSALQPSAPLLLDEVVGRATARDPAARPPAAELAASLVGSRGAAEVTERLGAQESTSLLPAAASTERLKNIALRSAAVLVVLIAGLLVFRLLEDDPSGSGTVRDRRTVRQREADGAGGERAVTTAVVPNVEGSALRDALEEVAEIDPDPELAYTEDGAEGIVLSTIPSAGSEVEAGTALTLVVGTGEGEGEEKPDKDEEKPEEDDDPGKGHGKAKGKEKDKD